MNDKNKLYSILLLSLFLTTFFMGYHIGYQRGVEFVSEYIDNAMIEQVINYNKKIYDPVYTDPWWDTNWTKTIIDNNTQIYYTENCTENQINEFIAQNSTYKEFGDCFIWRYD